MINYKIKKDADDKNLTLKLNGLHKKEVVNTNQANNMIKTNSDYDETMYKESMSGYKILNLPKKESFRSHMIGNKAVAFSTIVE